ncbi:MAG: hypothetical protein JW881_03945 [Spirochaetales bacterium]|nr:hypothetical protein [Spirochaetales bacterium]
MTRKELKDIISRVIHKLNDEAPSPACGLFWADDPNPAPDPDPDPAPTTRYAIGEEDATTIYSVGEEG